MTRPETPTVVPAYRGNESFLFVCYDHADSPRVFAEIEALVARGFRVYYDEGIHPGHAWRDDLAHALEACALLLMFVTPRSAASRNCQRELAFALDKDKPVLAVHLEETDLPPGIRLAIGDRQAVLRWKMDDATYRARMESAVGEFVAPELPRQSTQPLDSDAAPRKGRFVLWALFSATAALVVAYVGFQRWNEMNVARDIQARAMAEATRLIAQDQYGAAYSLLRPIVHSDGGATDPALLALWEQTVIPMTPLVSETEATVYFKPYTEHDGEWVLAGTTPFEKSVEAPKGVLRVKVEKPGFVTAMFAVPNPGLSVTPPGQRIGPPVEGIPLVLAREGTLPDDMVLVPRTNLPVSLEGWTSDPFGDERRDVPAFAIERQEVTNRQFKEFVDASGYTNPAYWAGLEFVDSGRTLSFDEARTRFVDRTGRPGPAGWALSTFPTGQSELPVGGISWYEAMAYARFRGRALPSVHHWLRAAFAPMEAAFMTAPSVTSDSRFDADGPVAARADVGLGAWGMLNALGNAREWARTFADDKPLVLGGAWSGYTSTASSAYTARPMDRAPEYGVRLMQLLSEEPPDPELLQPIHLIPNDDYSRREPVSDDAFEAMRFQFTGGAPTAESVAVQRVTENDVWVMDEVVMSYADAEVFTLYVVRPREHRGVLQPVIYGPHGGAFAAPRPNRGVVEQLRLGEIVVAGGRALVIPIWAGSYERVPPRVVDPKEMEDRQRRAPLSWYRDLRATLDYLDTQSDIDAANIGFFGLSFGSNTLGPILLAVEPRLKAAVLVSAGLLIRQRLHPMVDAVNYAPHIKAPILMVNGRFDAAYPFVESQQRLFNLLGTPEADKRQVVYDVGHFEYPHNLTAREVSDFFDKYLGPAGK